MDLVAENARLRAALERWQSYGCPDCSGDCGSANPPIIVCIMRETAAALATPAHDAVQKAAMVPEIAALIEAADNLMLNYLQDELCEPDLCVDDEHWAAIHDFNAALRAIEGAGQ